VHRLRQIARKFARFQGLTVAAGQIGVFALSAVLAFLLRFDLRIPPAYVRRLLYVLPVWIVAKSFVFVLAHLHRGWWRYVSLADLMRIVVGNLGGSALSCAIIVLTGPHGFPRSIYILDLMVCFLGTAGIRVTARMIAEASSQQRNSAPGTIAIIYGAGEAGIGLLREIQKNPRLPYRVAGFLDDDPSKKGVRILGIPVLGGGPDAAQLIGKHKIDAVLIAIPSARGVEMSQILERCHAAGVACKTVPGLGEVIEEGGLAGQMREVSVEDLLGRSPVRLEEDRIREALEGKVVLITGAAGSIGSELCRQIARFRPGRIVGFEIAESPLFELDREMLRHFPEVSFYPEIGSVQNRARVDEVLHRHSPSVIYHAAAYKHVPMMETHVFEAIENNVFGTYNVAASAARHGVDDFVMISSDKAVRPNNIMGATKRLAELLLLALQNGGTKYVAVRFGNVLGSNGSVIPIFRKQIAAGGPVTVTHPEMRRYFMTIPEACQLVLQAAVVAGGGQICVLDMGEPVKIVDLARNLILLSGHKPDDDIKIQFTGMRPGEKLYEELSSLIEDTAPSAHEKIRIYMGSGMPEQDMMDWLDCLHGICEARDLGRLVVALKDILLDYSPSAHLLRRVIDIHDRRALLAAD
jgi:FlaA1/EpsC-like NDP-sugar epimerase